MEAHPLSDTFCNVLNYFVFPVEIKAENFENCQDRDHCNILKPCTIMVFVVGHRTEDWRQNTAGTPVQAKTTLCVPGFKFQQIFEPEVFFVSFKFQQIFKSGIL